MLGASSTKSSLLPCFITAQRAVRAPVISPSMLEGADIAWTAHSRKEGRRVLLVSGLVRKVEAREAAASLHLSRAPR